MKIKILHIVLAVLLCVSASIFAQGGGVELHLKEYKVPEKQTIYSICKEFSVTQEELLKYNPELKDGLRSGATIFIPVLEKKSAETPVSSSKFIFHTIKAKETLFSISRMYNVQVEDIYNANPTLESVQKIGSQIKIPVKSNYISPAELDSLFGRKQTTPIDDIERETIKIAVLLPFFVPSDATANRFVEFYSGILLAAADAKSAGVSLEIYTYDTDRTEEKVRALLEKPEFKTVDFIIGPAYTAQIAAVADFAKRNRIYTLIPFSSKVADITANSYLFQFNPDNDTEIAFAAEKFSTAPYRNANIVFVTPQGVDLSDEGYLWTNDLQKQLAKNSKTCKSVQWTAASDKTAMENALKLTQNNLVIFRSEKYPVIQPYLSALTSLSADYPITLYIEYNWLGYSLQQNSVAYISPFQSEMNNFALADFQQKFAKFFSLDISFTAPRYDLLGYDLASCFIEELHKGGKNFANGRTSITYDSGIQSALRFVREKQTTGFVNRSLYLSTTDGE